MFLSSMLAEDYSVEEFFDSFLSDGGLTIVRTLAFLLLGLVILKIVRGIIRRVTLRSKLDNAAATFVISIVTVVLYIALAIVVVSSLGLSTAGIIAAFSAIALAIALALQDSLASLANGVIIIFTKPFKKGDYIEVSGTEGTVQDIRLFNTKILTSNNEEVIIPNSDILSETLKNTSTMPLRRVEIDFYLPYTADISAVRERLVQRFKEAEDILAAPLPSVSFDSFGEDSISCTAYAWSSASSYGSAKAAVKEIIYSVIKEYGAEPSSRKVQVNMLSHTEAEEAHGE